MSKTHDLIVVGAGPACHPAAKFCRQAGWRVGVVESGPFGGTCPNTGCNPKKVLLSSPEARNMAAHLLGKGLTSAPGIAWADLMAFKRGFTRPVSAEVQESYRELGVDIFPGQAVFLDQDSLRVGDQTLTAERFLVAVGAKPRPLAFPGAELVATSDDFLDLPALPKRLVFLGGGFISFELGHIAAACGAEVHIMTHGDKVLRAFDQDLVQRVVEASREMGLEVSLHAPVAGIEKRGQVLAVKTGQNGEIEILADMVVNGAGRVPRLDGLGLEAAGVAFDQGGVTVDEFLRSPTNPKVYAAGDCARTPFMLTPVADMESLVAGQNMVHGNTRKADYTGVPSVLFALPPLAMVGLTEEQCQQQGLACRKHELNLAESFPWRRLGEKTGFAKVLVDKASGLILGAHILGHDAPEIVNIFALAMRQGLPAETLAQGVWAYPTSGYYARYMV
jgi:glutathione reductase (NADPH)